MQWYLLVNKRDVLYPLEPENYWETYHFAVFSASMSSLTLIWKLLIQPIQTGCYQGVFQNTFDALVSKFDILAYNF